jgi:hypothetical protein
MAKYKTLDLSIRLAVPDQHQAVCHTRSVISVVPSARGR